MAGRPLCRSRPRRARSQSSITSCANTGITSFRRSPCPGAGVLSQRHRGRRGGTGEIHPHSLAGEAQPGNRAWEPYSLVVRPEVRDEEENVVSPAATRRLPEIRIPIDAQGQLLINFMGKVPARHRRAPDLPGPFLRRVRLAQRRAGPCQVAQDHGPGRQDHHGRSLLHRHGPGREVHPVRADVRVEIHANALNTIIMDNFLHVAPAWVNALILLGLALLTAFMASACPRSGRWSSPWC